MTSLTLADSIQIAILIVLSVTLIAIWHSMQIQNKLFRAQQLWYRFDMYRWTYEPVTDEQIKELELYPDDYMDPDKYKRSYRGNREALHRYISMAALYEYLAFTHALRRLKLADPLGYDCVDRWVKDLVKRKEFRDAHDYYRAYYPDFANLVDVSLKNIS